MEVLKRETGFEPAALALARRCSTTEPLAHTAAERIELSIFALEANVIPLNQAAILLSSTKVIIPYFRIVVNYFFTDFL